jgi:hypothetical protein
MPFAKSHFDRLNAAAQGYSTTELLLKLVGFDTTDEHRLLNQRIMDE